MGEIIQYALLAFFAGAILLSMWNDRQENKRMKLEAEQKKILTRMFILKKRYLKI